MKVSHIIAKCFIVSIGVVCVSLQSCKDLLGSIYDEPVQTDEYGFIQSEGNQGIIYIDATDYSEWTYIDFDNRKITPVQISDSAIEPDTWDMAVHRYDVKTNGGTVAETNCKNITSLKDIQELQDGSFVADEWSEVAVDMSDMINGNIIYSDSYVNKILSRWLSVDIGTMPPIYELSGNCYVLKLAGNTMVALKLRDFISASGDKGYLTIEYICPFEWNRGK